MWGEVNRAKKGVQINRITPTSVGRSNAALVVALLLVRITPTSVGRSHCLNGVYWQAKGLPPLVWGEGFMVMATGRFIRITPTSVGRSKTFNIIVRFVKDYPH